MWVLKVWKENRKEWFVIKAKHLEEMADLRDGAIRLGYLPNKKCYWEIEKSYKKKYERKGEFAGKSRGKSNKSLQTLYPEVGSLTSMPKKKTDDKTKRFRQNSITQSLNWF